jgi:hypothetical protein
VRIGAPPDVTVLTLEPWSPSPVDR